MQNLIKLFQRYLNLIVFIVLQISCFVFINIGNNKFHKASFANSSNAFVGGIYDWTNTVTDYFSLREINTSLMEENAQLLQKLIALNTILTHDSSSLVVDTITRVQYHIQPGSVVNNTINLRKNFLTINIGENQGIKPDMAIIGSKGVIGYTVATSNSYSVVMPVINENFKLSVTHVKSNSFGLVNWLPEDNYEIATIIDIPINVPVQIGDSIVSRGSDAMFPKDILVGIVTAVDNEKGQSFQLIKVKLAEDFSKIGKVKVIRFENQDEIKRLESEYYE